MVFKNGLIVTPSGVIEGGHARTYLYYARIAGCPVYIGHCTTKEAIAEIEKAKAEGLVVYSEIGTHYLVLHKDAWKINVPLRDRSTHSVLWQALSSGAIDCIGSDHVAHTRTRESMETEAASHPVVTETSPGRYLRRQFARTL